MASDKYIPWSEIVRHNTPSDCWVVLSGEVFNLTPFLDDHPAGAAVILQQAGKDGTDAFAPFHPTDIVERLGLYKKLHVGAVDPGEPVPEAAKHAAPPQPRRAGSGPTGGGGGGGGGGSADSVAPFEKPPLHHMLNLFDFEAVAQRVMSEQGWDYYSSGADDEFTLRENRAAFQRIWLRPRVLVDVSTVDPSCRLFGAPSAFPLYITATALGKLAHPDGETALTRAAASAGIVQMLPTLSSCTLDEMLAAKTPEQTQWFQLYVNRDRDVTARLVRKAEEGGCKALFVTVDAPCLGRREKDLRHKFTLQGSSVQAGDDAKGRVDRSQGTARAISGFIDPSLNWADLKWLRSITSMKLVLKGIQCGEDAVLAAKHGVDGIVVSNHGGRQLDLSRSGIEVLVEVMAALRREGLADRLAVMMDGGVRRGSDIFKALALGACCVGVGRPVLYGLASYGQAGVERVLQLLREEFEMVMRLMGVVRVEDICADHLVHTSLGHHLTPVPRDHLLEGTYLPLQSNL